MRILVTNDDGIHAEGLAALERIASRISDDVWIVAPETEQSGASRALTLAEPIRVRRAGPRRFAVRGTPTDCILVGIQHLLEGAAPDLVLSGVNRGMNAGEDVTMSGTVAGAIEGMAMGVPAIALSQMLRYGGTDADHPFAAAEAMGAEIVGRLARLGWGGDVVINVNFPACRPEAVRGVAVTRQGFRGVRNRYTERRTDLRGRDYFWLGYKADAFRPGAGTDLEALAEDRVSVTPLHIDLTHEPSLARLRAAFVRRPSAAEVTG